jgi:hypothetical protein
MRLPPQVNFLWIDPEVQEVEHKPGAKWLRKCYLSKCKPGEIPEIDVMTTYTQQYRLARLLKDGIFTFGVNDDLPALVEISG